MGTAPACAREALDMVRAGLGYLAAADATQLAAATQAECLRELEQAGAVATAARAAVLAAFTAGQGLRRGRGVQRGVLADPPDRASPAAPPSGTPRGPGGPAPTRKVVAALAAGQVSESVGRLICLWTNRLPEKFRDESDELLLAAAAGGLGLEELASLAAEMYQRARGDLPDEDPDAGLRGPRPEAGHHVRRRRGAARGPDGGVRGGGRAGAGRAGRPGRERR